MDDPECLRAALAALRHACTVAEILAETEYAAACEVLLLALRDTLKMLAG